MSETNETTNGQADEKTVNALKGYRRRKKVPIELEEGIVREFTIEEMLGGERQEWQKRQRARYGVDYQGQPAGIADFVGLEADLISCCLKDENGKPVPKGIVQGWPSGLQAALYQMCLSINSVSEKDQEKLKVN